MYALRFKWLSLILVMVVILAGFEIIYHAQEHITQNLGYLNLMLLIQCFHHHWARLISFRFVFIDLAHMISTALAQRYWEPF